MAPVKKKRVWNFSLDVPLGGVSRKQRKFIHTAVRNLVLQRRKSLDRQIESEVRDNLRGKLMGLASIERNRHSLFQFTQQLPGSKFAISLRHLRQRDYNVLLQSMLLSQERESSGRH